jgi:Ohr subfamily peroxiredoxin
MFVSLGVLSSSPGHSIVAAEKLLYTAKTHATGGREKGAARSSDGRLDVRLSMPGGPGTGTNPEQLLAAGWSACFASAMTLEACRMKIALPNDLAIASEVDLNLGGGGYFLRARLNIRLPGIEPEIAKALIGGAHQTCPYSKATRGNIEVAITIV